MDASQLKRDIDIRAVALAYGFTFDRTMKWAGHEGYRRGKEKLYISQKPWGGFFWNARSSDKGSVIDFVMRYGNARSAKEAIDELNGWTGGCVIRPVAAEHPKDHSAVQRRVSLMKDTFRHAYLETCRGIPAAELQHWRMRGRVKIDRHENAIFPHRDMTEITGYEIRGPGFKGFSKGGSRALWESKTSVEDTELVFSEAAIKAMAFHVLHDHGRMRLASTAGTISNSQKGLIANAIRGLPRGVVTAARDADAGGDKWTAEIHAAFREAGRHLAGFREWAPERHKDFDEELRESRGTRVVRLRTLTSSL